jgi:hypothetical protein
VTVPAAKYKSDPKPQAMIGRVLFCGAKSVAREGRQGQRCSIHVAYEIINCQVRQCFYSASYFSGRLLSSSSIPR